MKAVIALSIVSLVISLPSFSPSILNQSEAQISFPCPNGYQRDPLGVCVPVASLSPSLQRCPDGYFKSSSDCELVGASSPMLDNTTNQAWNQRLSPAQQPPNTGGAMPLQQQQPFVQSGPQQPVPSCPTGYRTNSFGLCEPIVSPSPTPQTFSDGNINSSYGASPPTLNYTSNQTLNQGLLQNQRQPLQNQTLSQSQMLPSAQQQQWVTYRDPSGTYAISYPSEWDSIPGRNGAVMFRAPPETFSDQYINAAVLVQTDRLPSQTNTLQAMTEDKLKSYSVPTPDDKLIESQGTSLSGLPAHLVHVQFLSMGNFLDMWEMAKLMALEVWTVNGDTSYSILYVAPVEKFEQYLPIAQQMINSFQILG